MPILNPYGSRTRGGFDALIIALGLCLRIYDALAVLVTQQMFSSVSLWKKWWTGS